MDMKVSIPLVGTILDISSISRKYDIEDMAWEITRTVTSQDERGQFSTMCTLQAVDADGEDLEEIDQIEANLDMYDYKLI